MLSCVKYIFHAFHHPRMVSTFHFTVMAIGLRGTIAARSLATLAPLLALLGVQCCVVPSQLGSTGPTASLSIRYDLEGRRSPCVVPSSTRTPLSGCGRMMPSARFFPPGHSRCLAGEQIEQPLATAYQSSGVLSFFLLLNHGGTMHVCEVRLVAVGEG